MNERMTHFGFETVTEAAKTARVRGVFTSVAGRYDLMNDLMSGGVHRLWKRTMIDALAPAPGESFLDLAGGTGDIAFGILERLGDRPPARLTVCDINAAMLNRGRDRAADKGLLAHTSWVVGNAENLPLDSASTDAVTIAFGLRNVTRIDAALREAHRVLRPGGRFLCLEFSKVVVPGLDRLYDAYSFGVLPKIGRVVARDEASYRYLAESIRQFPDQETLAAMMAGAGFKRITVRNLSGGIAALHLGWRI